MRFSCGKCGRSYVAADSVRERGFKMTCRVCGTPIVVEPSLPAERERDPFAPRREDSDGELVPLPPEPADGPEAQGDFDPFRDAPPAPAGGARDERHDAAPEPRGEAEAAFADLAREMETSADRALGAEHRTGELPLVAAKTGELTPTPPTPPPKRAAPPPPAKVPPPSRPAPPAPQPALARPKRSVAAPAVLAVLVLGAAAFGLAQLRSSPGREASSAPRAPQAIAPVRPEPAVVAPTPPAPAPQPPPAAPPAQARVVEPAPARAAEPAPRSAPPGAAAAQKKPVPARVAAASAAKRSEVPPRRGPATADRSVASSAVPAPPPASPQPPPAAGAATDAPLPPLDDAGVDAVFAREKKRFDGCIAAARAEEPGLALQGRTVTLTMTVNTSGKVLYPTLDDAALSATELGRCLKREAARMQFPPFGGDTIRVHKPIPLG